MVGMGVGCVYLDWCVVVGFVDCVCGGVLLVYGWCG